MRGFSQIDEARNCIASTAVHDGFAETLWIDSDIGFDPDDIERLRSNQLPVVTGLYAKKGQRQFASKFLPETRQVRFGIGGGLLEIMYAAAGFLLVRRQVHLEMRSKLNLPVCNTMFGESVTPWFQPLIKDYQDGYWYLGEDFAFSERIRQIATAACNDSSRNDSGGHGHALSQIRRNRSGVSPIRPSLRPYVLNCFGETHRCFRRCYGPKGLAGVGSLSSYHGFSLPANRCRR